MVFYSQGKANHVIDWEGAKVVDRENNQRLRQLREATCIRIGQSPHHELGQETYNLSIIYMPCLLLRISLVVSSPSPVTSRGQSHSLRMVLNEN